MSRLYKLPNQKLFYETPTGYAYIPNVQELNTLVKNKVIEPDTEQIKVRELPTRNASNTGKDSDFATKMPTSEALKNSLTNYQSIEAGQYGLEDTLKTAIKERTAGQTIEETNKLAKSLQGIEDPLLRSGLMRQAKQAKTARTEDIISQASTLYQQKIAEAKNIYDVQVQQYGMEQDVISQAFSSAILEGGIAPPGLPEEYTESWNAASTEAIRQAHKTSGGGGGSSDDKATRYNNALNQFLAGTTITTADGAPRVFTANDMIDYLNADDLGSYIDNFRTAMKGYTSIPDATSEGGFQFYKDFDPVTREEYVKEEDIGEDTKTNIYKKYFPEYTGE